MNKMKKMLLSFAVCGGIAGAWLMVNYTDAYAANCVYDGKKVTINNTEYCDCSKKVDHKDCQCVVVKDGTCFDGDSM